MVAISRIAALMALAVCLLVVCSNINPQDPPDDHQFPEDVPDDFHVRSDYFGQAVAPKYHYDYFIILDVVTTDTISFHPDYIESSPPVWIETFDATAGDLEELWDIMVDQDMFRNFWTPAQDTLFGAWTRTLQINADAEYYTVPKLVQDTSAANYVYRTIVSLVPDAAWDSLWTWRDRYISSDTTLARLSQ